MALTNGERLMRLETQMDNTNEKLDELNKTMKDFIDCADNKYASKLTEKVVYGMVGLFLTATILAIINLVI